MFCGTALTPDCVSPNVACGIEMYTQDAKGDVFTVPAGGVPLRCTLMAGMTPWMHSKDALQQLLLQEGACLPQAASAEQPASQVSGTTVHRPGAPAAAAAGQPAGR